MKSRYLLNVIDYVLNNEHEDFFSDLDAYELTEHEQSLLVDFYNDKIGANEEIKSIFKRLATYGYIYASAICLAYNIEE